MSRALIIVDPQNDFCEGGALAVSNSREIFPYINSLKKKDFFDYVFITKDWHPKDHVSFASRHGLQPFSQIQIEGKTQELWPDHCIIGTKGAQLSPLLEIDHQQIIVNKAFERNVDSYSGFCESNNRIELKDKLEELQITEVYVCGLAFDFCVGSTALDAKKYGFTTYIVKEGTKSVAMETAQKMEQKLNKMGVKLVSFRNILAN